MALAVGIPCERRFARSRPLTLREGDMCICTLGLFVRK